MRSVFVGGTALRTQDDVADALLDYALALSDLRRVDRVRIPVVTESRPGFADVLVGVGVALVAVDEVDHQMTLPGSAECARTLSQLTARLNAAYQPGQDWDEEVPGSVIKWPTVDPDSGVRGTD